MIKNLFIVLMVLFALNSCTTLNVTCPTNREHAREMRKP